MIELLTSLGVLLVSCLSSLFLKRGVRRHLVCGGVFVGSALGLIPAFRILGTGESFGTDFGSPFPGLTLSLGLDPLSAFFLVAIYGLSGLIGIYSWGYVKAHPRLSRTLPFFPLLVAAMAMVVTVRDGLFFLIVWEIMSLASFFLVTAEHEVREIRHAGWVYLIATHLATAFLIAFFLLLSQQAGSLSFDDFTRLSPLPATLAATLFLFAVIGFGTKAGIFPLHVWLPHAHPAAPSYISSLMSGVMIATGIYGILRTLTFLGTPPLWWGGLLMGLGMISAVLGVLYALVQKDLKKLLAYSSVENIGLILSGIGIGVIGLSKNYPSLIFLGFGGALLHVWNHAIFKGLLFLGAGNIVRVAHTRTIDQLGGLLKNMPVTGTTFLIASAAICGLPPLNGFISEWLILIGLFKGITLLSGPPLLLSIVGIVAIAFAGGLAIACFTKVIGVVFMGEPRSEQAAIPYEVSQDLLVPIAVLALLCIILGFFPHWVWPAVVSVVQSLNPNGILVAETGTMDSLASISQIFGTGLCILAVLSLLAWILFRKQPVRKGMTWDCGFDSPTFRMEYTASSFVQSLGSFFAPLLRPHTDLKKPAGFFPKAGSFAEHTEDLAERNLFLPVFNAADRSFQFIRRMQKGKIQNYLALIFLTLLGLLLWEVWFGI